MKMKTLVLALVSVVVLLMATALVMVQQLAKVLETESDLFQESE